MRALLVIDVQQALVEKVDFSQEKSRIKKLIELFKEKSESVIVIRHEDNEGPLAKGSKGAELAAGLADDADHLLVKQTESAFYGTDLDGLLKSKGVEELYITGFNTEFCCMFTAIAGYDRGYQVTYIEDCISTVHTAEDYQMPGLDIREFIGTVLYWSHRIEVKNFEDIFQQNK